MRVYIGTYTEHLPHVTGSAEGIYICHFDADSGQLSIQSVAKDVINPSFVALSPDGRCLYAAQELTTGLISAYAVNATTGELTLLNSQPSQGAHPCYVQVTAEGSWLLVANYSGATVSALPIGADGSLGPSTCTIKHTGQPTHHDGPHPHSIVPMPDGRYALVPDCGLDRVYIYQLGAHQPPLTAHEPPWVQLAPGAGPRHLALHANGKLIYCINERNSTMTTLAYDAEHGTLQALQTLSTLPEDWSAANSCADVHIHPSGRWLYGSNRGHDSIAIFAIDPENGLLSVHGHCPTAGRTPRNFAIDPSGTWLLAANQDSSTIVSFRIDQQHGTLTQHYVNEIPTPVCVLIAPS